MYVQSLLQIYSDLQVGQGFMCAHMRKVENHIAVLSTGLTAEICATSGVSVLQVVFSTAKIVSK